MDHPEPHEPTEWHASPALKRSILSGAAGWVDAEGAVAWPPRIGLRFFQVGGEAQP